MINTSESGDSGDSVIVQQNSRWILYSPVSSGRILSGVLLLNCPSTLLPCCFVLGSLCLQLTQYQQLASENSLGSISIIQPIYTQGTGREGGINLEACRRNYQPVWEKKASSRYQYFLSWAEQGGGRWLSLLRVGRLERQADDVCDGGEEMTAHQHGVMQSAIAVQQ